MIKIALLLVVAIALAEAYPSGYGYSGYGHAYGAPSFNERGVNNYQAHRQLYVNDRAEAVGAGTGTAYVEGVPGTDHSRYNGHYGNYGSYGYY